jgi:hypothetical protein
MLKNYLGNKLNKYRKYWKFQRLQLLLKLIDRCSHPVRLLVDLGGDNGATLYSIKDNLKRLNINVVIADINEIALKEAHYFYGFNTVLLKESGRLPFDTFECDIVYCNSVIEHVTLDKSKIWSVKDHRQFRRESYLQQSFFASEIRRIAKSYMVQTPSLHFPIESHTLLPFVQYIDRRLLIQLLNISNRFWLKKTSPDWNLLDYKQMKTLFPDAEIIIERVLGLEKSLIACRAS